MCSFLGLSAEVLHRLAHGRFGDVRHHVSGVLSYGDNLLLVVLHAEYLRIIVYIMIIAATVQLTEMFIKKTSPALFRELGVYLPLITTNCAVLAVPLFQTRAATTSCRARFSRLRRAADIAWR